MTDRYSLRSLGQARHHDRFGSNSEVRARNWAVRFTLQEQTSSAGPVRSEKCQEQAPNELTTRDTAATDGDLMPSESPLTESLLELSDLHCRTFGPCVILSSQFWKRPDRRPHRNGLTWACRVKDCRYAGSSQIFVG